MKNLPAPNFQVLSPEEFLEDFRMSAQEAKYRIWAQAMEVAPGDITNVLLHTIENAAKRGLDARLHVDYYSLLVTEGNPNYLRFLNPKLSRIYHHEISTKKLHYKRLEGSGVKLIFTNSPGPIEQLLPLKGRNHMKIVVSDNEAWIGGVNFNDWNFTGNDFMVKITDPKIVSHIATLYKKIDREDNYNDYKISCTLETSLLVDSGKMGESIILDNALELIQNAKSSVFMTTAFFPDTKMVKALHSVFKKGGEVKVVAPTPRSMSGVYKYVEKFNYEMMRLRSLKFPTKMIRTRHHAKLLIVDRHTAMFGSHNFSGRGVTLGTAEVAIKTSNKTLVNNLLEFFRNTFQKD